MTSALTSTAISAAAGGSARHRASSAIELRDLHKSFRLPGGGEVHAVDGLDLVVAPGEIVAFLGPNGADKTTTIDMLLELATPDSGSVRARASMTSSCAVTESSCTPRIPTSIFIGVIAIFYMRSRESGYVAFTVTLAMLLVPVMLPSLSGVPFYVSFVPALIWVGRQLGLRGERLAELARRQQAELAIAPAPRPSAPPNASAGSERSAGGSRTVLPHNQRLPRRGLQLVRGSNWICDLPRAD